MFASITVWLGSMSSAQSRGHAESLDFVVNRLFMKLFKTSNIDTVNYCRTEFQFELPCIVLQKRRRIFFAKYRLCENVFFCKFV